VGCDTGFDVRQSSDFGTGHRHVHDWAETSACCVRSSSMTYPPRCRRRRRRVSRVASIPPWVQRLRLLVSRLHRARSTTTTPDVAGVNVTGYLRSGQFADTLEPSTKKAPWAMAKATYNASSDDMNSMRPSPAHPDSRRHRGRRAWTSFG